MTRRGAALGRALGWLAVGLLTAAVVILTLLTLRAGRTVPPATGQEWAFVIADLIDGNARLRQESEALRTQLAGLQQVGGGGAVLQMLVDEVNALRVINGLVEVSGPGVEVTVSGSLSALDLQDVINELRNAGAEALALNGQRLVAWSSIGSDGRDITVDGQPIQPPYRLQAIGDAQALATALSRPGGLLALLRLARAELSISVRRQSRVTLPVWGKRPEFVYARPTE